MERVVYFWYLMAKQKGKSIVPPLSMIYRKIAISFVVLTVVLVGLIVFFSTAKATVYVTPKREIKSADFLVTVVSPADRGPASLDGALSAKIVGTYEEKVVEEEGQFEASGVADREGRATGRVTMTNTTSAPQSLVATTRLLSTDRVLFRMKSAATVPAKGTVEVEVYSDKPGPQSDIGPTKFTIPGLNEAKQKVIFGESKEPMQGGSGKVRVVGAQDIENAKAAVIEKTVARARDEFAKTPAAALGGVTVSHEVLEVIPNAKAGDEKRTFTVRAKIKATLLAYDKAVLERIAQEKVKANILSDRELVQFNKDAMLVRIKSVNAARGEAQLSVYADAQVRLSAESPLLDPSKIAGMLPEEAQGYLASFDAVEEAEVKLFPSWQKRIPTIPDRIKIVIKK